MNFEYEHLLPANFSEQSRVWIYQASRRFGIGEALEIENILNNFIEEWRSHGAPVKGYANLFFGQFLIFIADESKVTVGGCSTDSSVRVVKQVEEKFKVSMFDRQLLAFLVKDKVETIPLAQINYALENGILTPETIYFNNLCNTLSDLKTNWLQPIEKSWLSKKLKPQIQ